MKLFLKNLLRDSRRFAKVIRPRFYRDTNFTGWLQTQPLETQQVEAAGFLLFNGCSPIMSTEEPAMRTVNPANGVKAPGMVSDGVKLSQALRVGAAGKRVGRTATAKRTTSLTSSQSVRAATPEIREALTHECTRGKALRQLILIASPAAVAGSGGMNKKDDAESTETTKQAEPQFSQAMLRLKRQKRSASNVGEVRRATGPLVRGEPIAAKGWKGL